MPPCLIILGLMGNILAVVILSRPALRQTTTSLYLRFLAVFDSLVLCIGFTRLWIMNVYVYDFREDNSYVCKFHIWATYWVTYCASWLLVAVTVERCVSVWFPHKVKLIFTKRRTYIIIATVIVVMVLLSAHYVFGRGFNIGSENNMTVVYLCDNISKMYGEFEMKVWPWIDYTIYSVIPSTILILCNISIIHKVMSSSRNALRSGNDNTAQNRSVSSRKSQASSLTAMLLLTSTTYVICTTPFCIFAIYSNAFGSELDYAVDDLIWALVNMLQFTNNCINFILYCVSGKRFRDELRGLCFRKKQQRSDVYSTRVTSTNTT